MIVYDVLDFLDEKYDFSTSQPYDNVGHLVGSLYDKVKGILVCLDITDEVITKAIEEDANLIVSHHPVIFDPLKSVTDGDLVYRLVRNGISVISAHTNLDQADGGVNEHLAEIIGLKNIEKIADSDGFLYRIGEFEEAVTTEQLAKTVGEKLKTAVRYVGNHSYIKRVAVCSGSGGSMLSEIAGQAVDAYVTADIKHDVFLDAHRLGITLIDGGHFATEDIIVTPLAKILAEKFPEITVKESHFCPIKNA